MSIEIKTKIQLLHQAWPPNAILTTKALKDKGFSDQLIQKYCRSGWLKRLGVGAFVRQNDTPTWQGAFFSIQNDLKKLIHLGGITALELHGLAHNLERSPEKIIYLYNTSSGKITLPGWFNSYFNHNRKFSYTQCYLFNKEVGLGSQPIEGLKIILSEPERAILELLYLVPKFISVEDAANLVDNLQTIRPDIMQDLLEACRHILVKRLFLCLADLCQLPILTHLKINRIELGSGDRTINPGGKYFSKYGLVMSYNDNDNLQGNINV
jgi:hypothetical protein